MTGSGASPLVSIEGLRVEFPARGGALVAVNDIGFQVFPGEILGVVGESGSGKSVTSLALMQLTRFSGGRIASGTMKFARRNGRHDELSKADERQMRAIRGNEIGMIFQEPMIALNPSYTVGWQLIEGLMVHRGLKRETAAAAAKELLAKVRIPEPERRFRQYPHELSGGMCQRVVIAMALAGDPRLLIADEPTTALDVTVQAEILALIHRLRLETGAAILLITHNMAVVAAMADRIVVVRRGEVVETGTARQVILEPQEDYTRRLLAAVPRMGDMTGSELPERMPESGPQSRECKPLIPGADCLLDVKNLTKRFPVRSGWIGRTAVYLHAVEDVSFAVNRHETLSLVGESGSGKSTVGRCILRLEEPDCGEVIFKGKDLLSLSRPAMRRERLNMQMIFQDPYGSLNPQMRLADQVAEPIRAHRLDQGTAVEDRVAELFDRIHLPREFLRRFPSELSGGQRQRVAIARALALNPDLIVADEAVSALDVSIQAQVLNLLMELQSDLGLSYLFISHDMAVVERVSHRVAVMYRGRIVEIGSRRDIFENPQHEYTRALLEAVPKIDPDHSFASRETDESPPPSLMHSAGYEPPPSVYREITPGHSLLTL